MPLKVNVVKILFYLIKERLKHPFSFKKRMFEYSEPNIIYGYTDHPLDEFGGPLLDTYNILKKYLSKKAFVIREAKFKQRSENIFDFDCNGYNIYMFRPIPKEVEDEYPYPKLGRKPKKMTLRIIFLQPGIYRVLCVIGDDIPQHDTEMVNKDITSDSFSVEFKEEKKYFLLKTSKLSLKLYKNDFKIKILDKNEKLITESSGKSKNDFASTLDSFPLGFIRLKKLKRFYGTESFVLYPGEAVYGLGEQYSSFNKIGQTISLWNSEGCGNSSGRTYKNLPFFLSTRGYGIFVNESKPITFWIGSREYCKNMMAIEGSLIDYYFFYGPDFKTILYDYTELTGKSPVPPKWSFGTWMSRISYSSQEEVLDVAERLRKEKYPFDVIHVDTDWFEKEWICDWKFDENKFPDPKEMCEKLKRMGFKLSLWQTPYIMKSIKEYKETKKLKAIAKNHGAFMFLSHPSGVLDFSNPVGVKWYQEKLKNLYEIGASVIKVDFGEGVEPHQEFLNYFGREMHNLYPLLYQKAAFEITKEFFGKGIVWARSAYAGSQRFPVHWSGDSSSKFEEMLNVLRGGLSLGLCGFTYWSQDVGGFVFSPSDKLYIRWTQFSIFNSHIRYHGNPPRYREPWNYNEDAQRITRDFLNLRYQLIPYIYTEAHYASKQGLPMLAPLILEFFDDPNVFNIEDQFIFGRNMLIAPILTREDERLLYLPKGEWYDYWTFEKHDGSIWIKYETPINKIPIFLRDGFILPLGPIMQYINEKDFDSIDLIVIPNKNKSPINYNIIDDEQKIEINAEITNTTLNITISKVFENIKVQIPEFFVISDIKVNDEILSINKENNRIIAIKKKKNLK
ncbi:MAG: TIM-barrel domain-containing protein [Promethearchaeota archaeon]